MSNGLTNVSSFPIADIGRGIDVVGNYAYVAANDAGLLIFDVQDPTQPNLVASFDSAHFSVAMDVKVVNNKACVAWYGDGLRVIDVSDPADPQLNATIAAQSHANSVWVVNDTAFVSDQGGGLWVFNTTTYDTLSTQSGFNAIETEVQGNYACLVGGTSVGLKIFDVTSVSTISNCGNYTSMSDFEGITVNGDYAYVTHNPGSGNDGILILNISDCENPDSVGYCSLSSAGSSHAQRSYLSGDSLYVTTEGTGLEIVDVSSISDPTLTSTSYAQFGETRDVYVDENLVYLLGGDSGLVILSQPAGVISVTPPQHAVSVSPGTSIQVTFADDMDVSSMDDGAFIVRGMNSGIMAGTVAYDSPSRTATFTPTNDFATGELVFVTLSNEIESAVGAPLVNGHSWSFRMHAPPSSGHFPDTTRYQMDPSGELFGIVAADLNGDRNIDVATTNWDGETVSVRLGDGVGGFGDYQNYPAGNRAREIGSFDADGDGDLDLVTVNAESGTITVLYNSGSGDFSSTQTINAGDAVEFIEPADFDGDGLGDIATTCPDRDSVKVFWSSPTGFSDIEYTAFRSGDRPLGLVATDLNTDGLIDLAVANRNDASVLVSFNSGDRTFDAPIAYYGMADAHNVDAADLNGDGAADLVVISRGPTDLVWVLENDGSGNFGTPQSIDHGLTALFSVVISDFNGDNLLDLAVRAHQDGFNIAVLFGDGSLDFAPPNPYSAGDAGYHLATADFDNDGDLDMAVTDFGVSVDKFTILWQGGCCIGMTGNVNGDPLDAVDVSDVTALVNYLFVTFEEPDCMGEANTNGDAECGIDISDLTKLVNYLFITFDPLADCHPQCQISAQ